MTMTAEKTEFETVTVQLVKAPSDGKVRSHKRRKPKFEAAAPVTPDDHVAVVKFMQTECRKLKVGRHWLPQSATMTDESAEKMIATVGGERDGFNLSRRLFSSKSEEIQKLHEAMRDIDKWIADWTSPTVDRGYREIPVSAIEQFEGGLFARRDKLYALAKAAQAKLPEIIAFMAKKHGAAYNPALYAGLDISERVKVDDPTYAEYTIARDLPPAAAEREIARIKLEIDEGIEKKVTQAASTFAAAFENLSIQLTNRTYLEPPKNHPLHAALNRAEVKKTWTAELDDTIPEGSIRVRLQYDTVVDNKLKAVTEDFVFTEAEYKKLRPQVTAERRRIVEDTISGIFESLSSFRKKVESLGAYGKNIDAALESVRDIFSDAGGSAAGVAAHVREGSPDTDFRFRLAKRCDDVVLAMTDASREVKEVRRRVSKSIATALED